MEQSTNKMSELLEEYRFKNHRIGYFAKNQCRIAFQHMIGFMGDIPINSICYADVEDLQSFYVQQGLSKHSADSYIKAARSCFSWAERRSYIESNPFDGLKLFNEECEIHIFKDTEIEAMLSVAEELWQLKIITANTTGMRRSEILNTTTEDILWDKGQIHIRPKADTENTWQYSPKSRKSIRKVPLVPMLHNMLIRRMMELPAGQPYLYLSEKRYWTLRKRIGNIPYRVRTCPDENFTKPFNNILELAGIKKGKFHDLRKTCLTRWSRSMPYQELHRLAGHSDIKTTLNYYAAVGEEYIDRAAQISIGATGLEPATS